MDMQKNAAYPTLTQPQDLPAPRERTDSHVRIRPGRTGFGSLFRGAAARREPIETPRSVTSELNDEHLTLSMGLLSAQHVVDDVPRDPSAHAAAQSVRERIADMNELRSALGAVTLDACDPRMAPLLAESAPLTDYMRGLFTWAKAALRALEELARGLRVLDPNWATLRARLEDASVFYLADLERPIAEQATRLRLRLPEISDPLDPLVDFEEHLIQLFWAAQNLSKGLEKRFG
jgi:hypothetical protein